MVGDAGLQVVSHSQEWAGETPSRYGSFGGPEKPRKPVFEFGRLRHNHEFVCDFETPLLNATQAMGLAVACSAPKRAFLYM